jgi:hypothetical protein
MLNILEFVISPLVKFYQLAIQQDTPKKTCPISALIRSLNKYFGSIYSVSGINKQKTKQDSNNEPCIPFCRGDYNVIK